MLLFNLMVEAGRRGTQPLHFLLALLRQPRAALRVLRFRGASRRAFGLLVMQTLDNAMRLKVKRRLPGGGVALSTEQDPESPNQDKIPAAYAAGRWFAQRIGGTPYSFLPESVLAIPSTAHILGGAVIGAGPGTGVIDSRHHVFGYENCSSATDPLCRRTWGPTRASRSLR